MTGFRSSNGYWGFGFQFAKGTGVNPSTFVRLSSEESVTHTQEVIETRGLNADRKIDAIIKSAHKLGGTFQTYLRPGNGAELLAYCLGADAVSSSGGLYTHTITCANTIPWLSFERYLDNVERFIDSKINQIVITGSTGQGVVIDVNFLACDAAIQTSAWTATYQTDEYFMFHDGTYTINDSANTNIAGFTITITNGLEDIQTTSYKSNTLMEGQFDIEVTYRLKFEASDALYPAILFNESTSLVDTLYTGNFTANFDYGSGSSERQCQFAIPYLKVVEESGKHLDPVTKAVYLQVRAKAYYVSGSEIITITAKNDIGADFVSPSASTSPSSSASPSSSESSSNSPSASSSISPSSSNSPSLSPSASESE
jgi:hypothetical protein